VLIAAQAGACTHWGANTVYGDRKEVGRRLLGAPQVMEASSTNVSADVFALGGRSARTGASVATGSASGGHDSVKRTYCAQQAEIDYVQPWQAVPKVEGRVLDVAGGVTLGFVGLMVVMLSAIWAAGSESVFQPGDPGYEEPANMTAGYVAGGALVAAGAGWMAYSFAALPSGPPPPVGTGERTWTASELVAATGCGLVPGDTGKPPPPPGGDVAERLQKLEKLHKAGLITDAEYRKKRKELLDGL
jgi:hypothetical protein